MADDPGAGPLYGRGDFRCRRVRQDVGVYAPVRAPTLRLAGDESRAARGGAGPGSEGRFLPRHPPDADRAGPRRGLHRAESRWSADVESSECHLARFVLARVHGRVPPESTLRQGQGTLLATGLHEPRPLDHRALPRAARRMGDASRRCITAPSTRRCSPTRSNRRRPTLRTCRMRGSACRRRTGPHTWPTSTPSGSTCTRRWTAAPPRAHAPGRDRVPTGRHIEHQIERTESTADDGDPAPGRSRPPLVCPRLEHPRQQDPVEHRGRGVRVPQHVRLARPSPACFARPRPRRGGCAARPNRGRPTTRATNCPRSPPPP